MLQYEWNFGVTNPEIQRVDPLVLLQDVDVVLAPCFLRVDIVFLLDKLK